MDKNPMSTVSMSRYTIGVYHSFYLKKWTENRINAAKG